mmetsp:Transcript_26159/g.35672  ORF Transcript_26159/g.35672 Transcript_26159/m.35672 type:complete len:196 (-) Transcript_26159:93-680(-)
MDPGAFAAQMRAQAMQHAAQAQQRHTANAAGRKRCASIALVMHVVLAVVITGLLWALYYQPHWTPAGLTVNKADHPWPMWFNWIWMVVILGSPLFTLCSTLPLICSCRLWPMIVVGNLVVVNVMLWIIYYGISACRVHRYRYKEDSLDQDICDSPWPLVFHAWSIVIVIIASAIACLTHKPSTRSAMESGEVVEG